VNSHRRHDADEFEALLASIHHTPIATVITDPNRPDNPIVAANAAFCALTGYTEPEIIGRNCRFLTGPATETGARAALAKAVTEAVPTLVELTNYRRDGSAFRNAVMIAPVRDVDGRLACFIGSQMDVGAGAGLSSARTREAEARVASLTPRQREVLEHLVRGLRNKQIAALIGIDEKTVKMHRARLLEKLAAKSSADAIRIGVEAGLQLGEGG
jgi:PAS domain S-box-containing protein